MATYEGKWRCPGCSTVNLGRNLNCLTCGVKRGDDVEFFLDDDAAIVSDADLLRQANAGADWNCRYCSGNNHALDQQCSSCGNNRSDGDKQLTEETRGIRDWSKQEQKAARVAAQTQITQLPPPRKSLFSSRPFFKFAAGGLAVVFAVFFLLSSLTHPAELEVTNLEWTRTIALEDYKTVRETAWEGEVPANARIQSQAKAVHHNDKVPNGTRTVPETYSEQVSDGEESYVCGKTNKGNGYFEDKYCTRTKYKTVTGTRDRTETIYKDVPVYKIRYDYLIDKWVSAGEKTTSGTNFKPQWATVQINGTHREAKRTETYNLLCREIGGDKSHEIKLTAKNWSNFTSGKRLHVKINYFGALVSVDELPDGE
jgi:hypothetical protein